MFLRSNSKLNWLDLISQLRLMVKILIITINDKKFDNSSQFGSIMVLVRLYAKLMR